MSTVPTVPPIKYVLGYRSRTLNPNPITDPNPNPKINKKQNDTGMKFNIVISKAYFTLPRVFTANVRGEYSQRILGARSRSHWNEHINQSCSPRDQGLGLEAPPGQK